MINQWSKLTTWETSKGNHFMTLIPTLTILDGGITLTLVREETKIRGIATFKIQSPIPLHSPLTQQITSIESAIEKLTLSTTSFVQSTNAFIEETRANFKNQGAAIKNLKVQVGQLTKQLSEISLNHITNIREECNAIFVRMAEEAPQEEEKALQEEQESVVEEVPQKINPSSSPK
ncbi:hypothetical protein PIB30_085811 [Stylosanthes scabra]|uniref:Uncharacterized protein n=1 Tax=Stylosanthes scabra TaxID=79078 RepID=A0ABU6ZRM0_9FABA|nr:hypothetical protein [Stylosanthes scabra]